ncbi:hypothetical protein DCO48_09955 [Pseudomonas sp. SDI]|uniref:alpha-xenorhabdolysin family binary toxin subunit B n=1 Tax=Pseudomonas sp. SDI TaxID=2170734 RepID=UPI000DE76D57|nr:alpha-xenorhabdolysin family binary toxin subunit B [Pseudomonas sp. SDI]PWB33282.1 hypothetical protein DCO48_09955 [Pseudomonas sp. SDI]
MNNVKSCPLSGTIELPDINAMKLTKQAMHTLVRRDSDALGAAPRAQLIELLEATDACEDYVAAQVLRSLVKLNNQSAAEAEQELQRIAQDVRLTPAQREEAKRLFQQDLEQEGQRLLLDLRNQRDALQDRVRELQRFALDDGAEQVATLTLQLASLNAELDKSRQALAAQRLIQADLDKVIEAFSPPSLSRLFKGQIPSEGMIDQLLTLKNLTDFDSGLLKDAARLLEQHIDLVAKGRRYADVVVARDRARRNQLDRQADIDAGTARQARLEKELSQWQGIGRLDQLRQQWLSEASKVPEGLSFLLLACEQQLSLASLNEGLRQVACYFGVIRKRYEDA